MGVRAREITQQCFGHNLWVYVPLYLFNKCTNGYVYCGYEIVWKDWDPAFLKNVS